MQGTQFALFLAIPPRTDIFEKPAWGAPKPLAVRYVEEIWAILQWRRSEQGQQCEPHARLRPDLQFLAHLRYRDVQRHSPLSYGTLPLTPYDNRGIFGEWPFRCSENFPPVVTMLLPMLAMLQFMAAGVACAVDGI